MGHIVLAVIDFVIMLASRHLGCGLIINLGADFSLVFVGCVVVPWFMLDSLVLSQVWWLCVSW